MTFIEPQPRRSVRRYLREHPIEFVLSVIWIVWWVGWGVLIIYAAIDSNPTWPFG
jgi:hypothetical protein